MCCSLPQHASKNGTSQRSEGSLPARPWNRSEALAFLSVELDAWLRSQKIKVAFASIFWVWGAAAIAGPTSEQPNREFVCFGCWMASLLDSPQRTRRCATHRIKFELRSLPEFKEQMNGGALSEWLSPKTRPEGWSEKMAVSVAVKRRGRHLTRAQENHWTG